jgi:hypothetical protein
LSSGRTAITYLASKVPANAARPVGGRVAESYWWPHYAPRGGVLAGVERPGTRPEAPLPISGSFGDASDEAVLRQAGIERAQGLICAVDSDAENVFITIEGLGA